MKKEFAGVFTPMQLMRFKRDLALFKDYEKGLKECPTRSKTQLIRLLSAKYGFTNDSGVYAVLSRMTPERVETLKGFGL